MVFGLEKFIFLVFIKIHSFLPAECNGVWEKSSLKLWRIFDAAEKS